MSSLLVAGERPSGREKEPFTNKAGRQFRQLMDTFGVPSTKATFLYPESVDEIDELDPEFVILCGNKVLQLVHPGLRTGQCHGRLMLRGVETIVMSVFHHEAFVRAPKQMTPVLEQELRRFRYVAGHRDEWERYVPDTCVKCRGPRHRVTPQYVVYCQEHWIRPAPVR